MSRALLSVNAFSLTLVTIVAVVGLFLARVPILDLIEWKTYDLRYLSRGVLEPSPAVALAMIDEKSLDMEGRWPWPRTKIAALVDRLSEAGAKVVAFDIGFLESENATNDAALAHAIGNARPAIVLGYFFHMRKADLAYSIARPEIERRLERIAASKYPLIAYRQATPGSVGFLKSYAPECNIPTLSDAADGAGYLTVRQDADGVVRRMPMMIQGGDELFPPISLVAAWLYLDKPPLKVSIGPYGVEGIQMGDRWVPTDAAGRMLVNYLGPPRTFQYFSVGDILAGRIAPETFRDRIVLVAASAAGLYDTSSTPFGPAFPGSEIHATVMDNILTRRFVTQPSWARVYDVFAIVGLVALLGLVLPHLSGLFGLLFAAGLAAAHVFVARQLFVSEGVWLDIVYPVLGVVTSYTALSTYRFVAEQRERRKVRSAFGRYVAPVVIEEMLKEPSRLSLGGEERVVTVLFSDLQGFTSYSERYSPREMIQLLGEYYARMTERVFARKGMLKEYVGDELMAIFGAPIENAAHAELACLAALDMKAERRTMTEEWLKLGRPPLVARTGVNSGPMLVGNIGSEYRLSYGVLGDNVNLGSRLEGLNKQYGTDILIGENTANLVGDRFVMREVDIVRAVGKTKPTRIYELLAVAGTALAQGADSALRAYAAGLAAYREQQWQDALRLFREASTHWPGDKPSLAMIERCQLFEQTPPPEDWGGVFEATRK